MRRQGMSQYTSHNTPPPFLSSALYFIIVILLLSWWRQQWQRVRQGEFIYGGQCNWLLKRERGFFPKWNQRLKCKMSCSVLMMMQRRADDDVARLGGFHMWRPIIQETVQGDLIGRRGLRIRTTDLPYAPIQGMWEAACQRKHGKSAHCSQKSHPVQNSPSFNIALPCKSWKNEFYIYTV